MGKKASKVEEVKVRTVEEIRDDIDAKKTELSDLRKELKVAEERELLSAKKALGEAVAGALFADNTDAILALVQVVNKPEIADALRQILGVNNDENDALEEPQDEAQWASAEGDDQDRTSTPQEQW